MDITKSQRIWFNSEGAGSRVSASRRRSVRNLVFLALFVSGISPSLFAATYYVATSGNNTNPGTQGSPWLTVQKAANTMVAGDTVIVASGNYDENVTTVRNGVQGSPITFIGVNRPRLAHFALYHNWTTVDNFKFTGTYGQYGMLAFYTNCNIRITRNLFYDVAYPYDAITATGPSGEFPPSDRYATNVYVAQNIITNTGKKGLWFWANNSLIESNYIDHTQDDAIDLWGDNNIIRRNIVTNLYDPRSITDPPNANHIDFIQTWAGDAKAHATNNLIEGNLVINNSTAQMSNLEDDGYTNNFHHWTFRNNVYINNYAPNNVGISYTTWENNTFYKSPNTNSQSHYVPIFFLNQSGFHGVGGVITNNIFASCGFSNALTGLKLGYYGLNNVGFADYNYVCGLLPGLGQVIGFVELHGINGGNPLFANPDAGDVRLRTGSPAIGRGANLSGFFGADRDGRIRGSFWDIGACKYEAVAAPIAPTGLRVQPFGSP